MFNERENVSNNNTSEKIYRDYYNISARITAREYKMLQELVNYVNRNYVGRPISMAHVIRTAINNYYLYMLGDNKDNNNDTSNK